MRIYNSIGANLVVSLFWVERCVGRMGLKKTANVIFYGFRLRALARCNSATEHSPISHCTIWAKQRHGSVSIASNNNKNKKVRMSCEWSEHWYTLSRFTCSIVRRYAKWWKMNSVGQNDYIDSYRATRFIFCVFVVVAVAVVRFLCSTFVCGIESQKHVNYVTTRQEMSSVDAMTFSWSTHSTIEIEWETENITISWKRKIKHTDTHTQTRRNRTNGDNLFASKPSHGLPHHSIRRASAQTRCGKQEHRNILMLFMTASSLKLSLTHNSSTFSIESLRMSVKQIHAIALWIKFWMLMPNETLQCRVQTRFILETPLIISNSIQVADRVVDILGIPAADLCWGGIYSRGDQTAQYKSHFIFVGNESISWSGNEKCHTKYIHPMLPCSHVQCSCICS